MAKSEAGKRPRLMLVSEEMRRISALLSEELLSWPGVTARPMFGMRAYYRGAVVFAMLPDKRAVDNPKAIAYKLPAGAQTPDGPKWRLLQLETERDISQASACLDKAYRWAGSARK